jgi:thiol-disulfide isomerase/thioredoxin
MTRTGMVLLALFILIFLYSRITSADNDTPEPVGSVAVVSEAGESVEPVVDFEWKDADGNEYALRDYRGKAVLINFWATWCVPCRKEIPDLIEINTELDDASFVMIGISVDAVSDINKVDLFIQDQRINYINILDDGRLQRQFGSIRAIPTTILLDKEGVVRESIVGVRTKEQFLEKILPLL